MSNATSRRTWEELRKEAKKLESEMDVKMASFAKLCSSNGSISEQNGTLSNRERLLASDEDGVNTEMEIEQLLGHLADVNTAMGNTITASDTSRSHALVRHRDILSEFNQEFKRLRNNNIQQQSRNALFSNSSSSNNANGDHVDPEVDAIDTTKFQGRTDSSAAALPGSP